MMPKMSIKPQYIKLLREKTGAGMMDCKTALSDTVIVDVGGVAQKKKVSTQPRKVLARDVREGLRALLSKIAGL